MYLADEQEIFRTGLRTVLVYAGDIEFTGESGIEPDLLDRLETADPHVIVLGARAGISETIEAIKNRFPELKVLLLGTQDGDVSGAAVPKLDGYINKDSSSDFIRVAIKMVVLGGTVWHPDFLKLMTGNNRQIKGVLRSTDSNADPVVSLTLREKRLLLLLADGKTNKLMGMELGIAQVTVKKALQSLFRKIGVTNRTQAAMKASQLGLV